MPNKEDMWARAGDAGRCALLACATLLPLRRRDPDSSFDALTAILVSSAISKAVKAFWREPRPNGEDDKSFPSQHAAECFAAAVCLSGGERDGLATRAVAAAGAVAATRVLARKHHVLDVIAGAAIGISAGSLKPRG